MHPSFLCSNRWNANRLFLDNEPFKLDFFQFALQNGVKASVLNSYLTSKYTWYWINYAPDTARENIAVIKHITPQSKAQKLKQMFEDSCKQEVFDKHLTLLKQIAATAVKNNSTITFVLPPLLVGTGLKHETLIVELNKLKRDGKISYLDLTNEMNETFYFSDHDHLNTKGVCFFTTNYLAPHLTSLNSQSVYK